MPAHHFADRHIDERLLVRQDTFVTGTYQGQRLYYMTTLRESEAVAFQENMPSGSTVIEGPGDARYEYWAENVEETGFFKIGDELHQTDARAGALILWVEFWMWPQMEVANQTMIDNGLNAQRRRQGLTVALVSWGVPYSFAETVADNWVDNDIKPSFAELGMVEVPFWSHELADAITTLENQ